MQWYTSLPFNKLEPASLKVPLSKAGENDSPVLFVVK